MNSNTSNEYDYLLYPQNVKDYGSEISSTNTNDSEDKNNLKKKNIPNLTTPSESVLSKIDQYDKNLSQYIYDLEFNEYAEFLIFIFARLFNPDLMICYFILMFSYFAISENNYTFIIKPLCHVLLALIITIITKYIFGRPRPEINPNVKRRHNCRNRESNCSMPSGDSMQCASFAVLLVCYFGNFLGFILIPFVMFSRIFYFCHYIMDTIIGTLLGLILSSCIAYPLKLIKI
jgi:membrane-associated phospholipid phosphatase